MAINELTTKTPLQHSNNFCNINLIKKHYFLSLSFNSLTLITWLNIFMSQIMVNIQWKLFFQLTVLFQFRDKT